MVVVECSVPDCTFTTDDVSEALAIALLSNHNLAHCNLAPTVADAAPAPTAPRSNQAPVSVDLETSSKGVMVIGRGNRVAVGTEQQILRENEALKALLKEQQEIIEARKVIIRLQQEVDCQDYKCKEKERELLKRDEELSELNLRLTGEIMRINRTIAELKKVNPEMARRTGDGDMDVDMLPVSPESTPEGPGTTGNQEDVMATENTGLRTPLETNSCKDSAVQKGMGRRKKFPEEHVHLPWIPIKREKKEDELSSQNWKVEFLGTEVAVQKPRKCDHVTRLLNAWRVNLGIDDVMLEIGPSRLTVGDLWTLLPPHEAAQCYLVTSSIRDFVGGWLVDKVVEAVLWKFTLQYDGLF
ncbi:unnamed protein product [Pocillopora meandrina]|uniref:Uncharacterized protein n=1 Tax=Pocillopora meandrina TaxID=46732 RepID=A0AAU9X592_9CNID|nr:unnamed protein product [Pocillopora meandrina]